MGQEFRKCERCSTDKIEVFHTVDGSKPGTGYRLLDSQGKPGLLIIGEPPAHLVSDSLSPFPTSLLGMLALALLGGERRPDAASVARAMAERAADTAPPVKLDADGKPCGPRPGDPWNANPSPSISDALDAAFGKALKRTDPPAKPADDPKVPAKPLKSLGLHICEDGGVVVTEWPEGEKPLTCVFASKSAGHAVNYAFQALQKARQEQREARRGKDEAAARAEPPFIVAGVDFAGGPDQTGFGIRP